MAHTASGGNSLEMNYTFTLSSHWTVQLSEVASLKDNDITVVDVS